MSFRANWICRLVPRPTLRSTVLVMTPKELPAIPWVKACPGWIESAPWGLPYGFDPLTVADDVAAGAASVDPGLAKFV